MKSFVAWSAGWTGAVLLLIGCSTHRSIEYDELTPSAVTSAIMSAFPDAKITSAKAEKEDIDLYEVSFTDHGKKKDADVTPDGTILSTEETLEESEVPPQALASIKRVAGDAKIDGYEKTLKIAVVNKDTKTVTKVPSMMNYEAALSKDGMKAEVVVGPDGTVVESPEWKKKDQKRD